MCCLFLECDPAAVSYTISEDDNSNNNNNNNNNSNNNIEDNKNNSNNIKTSTAILSSLIIVTYDYLQINDIIRKKEELLNLMKINIIIQPERGSMFEVQECMCVCVCGDSVVIVWCAW